MRKPEFLSELVTLEILGSKYAKIFRPFGFYSAILGREIWLPIGFIFDYESVIGGTSKRGGAIHDYLSRTDSDPIVSKQVAASVYLEVMTCRDAMLRELFPDAESGWSFIRSYRFISRWGKSSFVRVWPGYFHKLPVMATLEEIKEG